MIDIFCRLRRFDSGYTIYYVLSMSRVHYIKYLYTYLYREFSFYTFEIIVVTIAIVWVQTVQYMVTITCINNFMS